MSARGAREIARELADLWQTLRPEALERVAVIEDAVAALAANELEDAAREEARRAAHKLRGSAGMYGFHRASEIAAELEEIFAAEEVGLERMPEVASLVLALRAELEAEPDVAPEAEPEGRRVSLLLVTEDREFGEAVRESVRRRDLDAEVAGPDDAPSRVQASRPDLVLADLEDLGFLSELTAAGPDVPVLAIAAGDSLLDRVEVVRRGAIGFLDRALSPDALIDAAERFAARGREEGATVLAVDDDASVLAALDAILARHGFRVRAVDEADGFWHALEEVAPDLAIVDFDMPQVNGLELCQAVRSDPRWSGLPLLILTAYRDSELVRRAFIAGADDYLSKPIIEEELVGRVRNRLARVRAAREGGARDELTGLPARPTAVAELERLAELARSAAVPFSIAVLDVDRLAELNERAGLAAGDAALRAIGERLRTELAGEAAGRWDGGAFIVGLNGVRPAEAARRIGGLVERLNGGDPAVTVSAGLAGATPEGIAIGPIAAAAERALAEAKRQGGARMVAAGPAGEPEGERVDVAMVEDDDSVVGVLDLALSSLGLTSRRLADGSEAVAALAAEPPPLVARMILLDWDLPGLDGLSVLRRLRDAGVLARTRVIMLTARASEEETLKALELGASDHVAKPFSVPVLTERVKRALEL